jgi:hypothetical protein
MTRINNLKIDGSKCLKSTIIAWFLLIFMLRAIAANSGQVWVINYT